MDFIAEYELRDYSNYRAHIEECGNVILNLVNVDARGNAEGLYRQVVNNFERLLGPNNKVTLSAIRKLGDICLEKSRYDEANNLFLEVLQRLKAIDDMESLEAVKSLCSLTRSYVAQGNQKEVDSMLPLLLEFYERRSRIAEFLPVLVFVLCSIYESRNDIYAQEAILQRSMEDFEEVCGLEGVNTLTALVCLSDLQGERGEYLTAEANYKRALEGCKGPGHSIYTQKIDNLKSMALHGLALVYYSTVRLEAFEAVVYELPPEQQIAFSDKMFSLLNKTYGPAIIRNLDEVLRARGQERPTQQELSYLLESGQYSKLFSLIEQLQD